MDPTKLDIEKKLAEMPESVHLYIKRSLKPHDYYRRLYEREVAGGNSILKERWDELDRHFAAIKRIAPSPEAFQRATRFLTEYMML